jgi:serine/threonine-protein kinase
MNEGLIGRVLAGQRIEAVAGRGGMGVVYRARDIELDRVVAVKVIAPGLADDPGFRRRFIGESRTAASLDHPNVIPIYRAGEEDGVLFQVMRFVDGSDLRRLLADTGPLDAERAVRILTQVASALDGAHAGGLVHRDVKPANILLGAKDHVYLTDFGLSKRTAGSDDTRTAQLVGTVNYVAPEQIRGQPLDLRADIYALGAVLFQMLTGRVPFPAESDEAKMWAHLSEKPPSATAVRPELPRGLDDVIRRAMAKEPRDRFPTAGELATAASGALGWPEPAAKLPAVRSSAPPPAARPAAKPYTRADYRRALVLNAMTDSLSVVAAAVILIAGILFGALGLAVPLAIVVYAGGAARAFFDDDTAAKVLEREREKRRGALDAGDATPDTGGLTDDIRVPLERAHAIRRRIHEAIERADMPYDEVSAEVDQLVATMEQTAKRAQLLHEGLDDAPPADIESRLEQLRARNHPSQRELVAALEYQLSVQRRMEQQLERFHDQMDRMLVELDTVRGNLISASASEEAYQQKRVAAGIRELRDEMGLVAEGVAAAYDDQEDASSTLERVTGDG